MAGFNFLPGMSTGIVAQRYSSNDGKAIGKLTDVNHISSLDHKQMPAKYDKAIISLYTQTASPAASDFQQMLAKSKPFDIPKGAADYWMWEAKTTYQAPKIVAIPDTTRNNATAGIDGQIFEFVLDKGYFYKNQVITADERNGQRYFIVADPEPYGTAFLYKATIFSETPVLEVVDKFWLSEGREYMLDTTLKGEFTQDGPGLGPMADKINLYESLGAGAHRTHTVTGWAEERGISADADITVYAKLQRNEGSTPLITGRLWEPTIERLMREDLLREGMWNMIWGKGGTARENGGKQEQMRKNSGVYHKMRKHGNYTPFPRGGFSINLLRQVFGDLFSGRVAMGDRRVKLYTNEAGFDVFEMACKRDALASGITFTDNGTGNGFTTGSGLNRMISFGFNKIQTRETGIIELIHLAELEVNYTTQQYVRGKKAAPIFIVLDVSPTGDGMGSDNIRIVQRAGTPNLRWSYIDGQMHHLGPMASQGHSAANSFDGYTINMSTRRDIFIEDLSRTVLIEETPLY